MPRAVVILAAALAVVVLGALGRPGGSDDAGATAPSTTTTVATTTTTVAGAVPTTTAPIPVRRGGAEAGSIAKPEDEAWTVRRMITTTAVCVLALAAAGFVYGRIRSAPPRHPDLVHEPD